MGLLLKALQEILWKTHNSVFRCGWKLPNASSDPTDISTLETLSQKMKEANADLGIAFDGDRDKNRVMDKNGFPVLVSLLTAAASC